MLNWMLIGYLFLLIVRPYEYWPALGTLHIERVYMILFMLAAFLSPKKRVIPNILHFWVGAFFLAMVFSALFAVNGEAAWFMVWQYAKVLVFYVMVLVTVRDEREFRRVIWAFVVIMLIYVGKSAWEFFLYDRYVFRMGIKRMVGMDATYAMPNAFSASIVYSLPFIWALIRLRPPQPWVRWMLWGYGVLAVVAVIYSGSRSGMFALLFFFLLLFLRSTRKAAAILGILLALSIAWSLMPTSYQDRFLSSFMWEKGTAGARASAEGRLEGLRQGGRLLAQYPLFGIGPANFYFGWEGLVRGPNAHSLYGQVIGELGGIGTICFGLVVLGMFRQNKKIMLSMGKITPGAEAARAKNRKEAFAAAVAEGDRGALFRMLMGQAVVQTAFLLMFKGLADHNLYRYTWLWLAAVTVLNWHFSKQAGQAGEKHADSS